MTRMLSTVAFLLSAVFLFLAITSTIIVTKLATVDQFISSIYTFEVYSGMQSDPAQATPERYEQSMKQISSLLGMFLLGNEVVAAKVVELTAPQAFNVLQGVRELWRGGNTIPAILVFAFSVAFPIAKTAAFLLHSLAGRGLTGWFAFLHATNKYTMVDVFVVSVAIFAFSRQALVGVEPGISVVYYVLYMIASYGGFLLLRSALWREGAAPGGSAA